MWNYARTIGENIQEAMLENDMSIKEFSDKFGCTTDETARLLDGRLNISIQDIHRISNVLDIPLERLAKQDNKRKYISSDDIYTLFFRD